MWLWLCKMSRNKSLKNCIYYTIFYTLSLWSGVMAKHFCYSLLNLLEKKNLRKPNVKNLFLVKHLFIWVIILTICLPFVFTISSYRFARLLSSKKDFWFNWRPDLFCLVKKFIENLISSYVPFGWKRIKYFIICGEKQIFSTLLCWT